ncbi:hypothetical protein M446_0731 [Methylobacterium sp. 4-46]|nr:hypothetical protein M446_0731 [Methylobacterium sp. 4-46]
MRAFRRYWARRRWTSARRQHPDLAPDRTEVLLGVIAAFVSLSLGSSGILLVVVK